MNTGMEMFSAKHYNLVMVTKLGEDGERVAARFLERKGYEIIKRNERLLPFGEIDIVARSPHGVTVFVEVKTMVRAESGLQPEDQLSPAKIRKMVSAAQAFITKHPATVEERAGWRIDAVTVQVPSAGPLTNTTEDVIIRHYENLPSRI